MARRKGKAKNEKDFDVMNPEEQNPNIKHARNKMIRAAAKAAKAAVKAAAKLLKAVIKLLASIPIVGWILIAALVIALIYIVISTAWNMMPGMMKAKLRNLININPSDWFMSGAVSSLDENYKDIIDVANYLESMDYSLVGEGFVTPVLEAEKEYSLSDVEVRDSEGVAVEANIYMDEYGIIRNADTRNEGDGDEGEVIAIRKDNLKNYRLIRSYLLSDYRIYTLKNADQDFLKQIYDAFATIGGNHDAWAKGLIKLYEADFGIADAHWWWGNGLLGNTAEINGTTLVLKKGWFNEPMSFSIVGWAPRYGMSLDFLLSLHLGTSAPDLVNAMLQNFDTEVQVYLDDSGNSQVLASYVDIAEENLPKDEGTMLEKVKSSLDSHGHPVLAWSINDRTFLSAVNDWVLNGVTCQILLKDENLHLHSPDNCTGEVNGYLVEESTYESDGFLYHPGNTLEYYGITQEKDAEVYSVFETYENVEFAEGNRTFDARHCTQEVDYTADAEDDYYTMFSSEAAALGCTSMGTPSKSTIEVPDVEGYENSEVRNYYSYQITRVKNHNVWYTTIDGSEVSVEWVSFKYLIHETLYHTDKYTNETTITEETDNLVMVEYIIRDKTKNEAIASGSAGYDENGNYIGAHTKCSESDQTSCCIVCQNYVKQVIRALASVSDSDYSAYVPYIARVVGSWFRDTYFVIPTKEDTAIREYAGKMETFSPRTGNGSTESAIRSTNHPEVNMANAYGMTSTFVKVDENYLGDSGEYWTEYKLKDDGSGEYQLYLLAGNGTTTNTKMEDFLTQNGFETQEDAEKEGWAFVKKAEIVDMTTLTTSDEHTMGVNSIVQAGKLKNSNKVLWTAYDFNNQGYATDWTRVNRYTENEEGEKVEDETVPVQVKQLYDMIYGEGRDDEDGPTGIFYSIVTSHDVTQVEDAQRGETNTLVKYLFKYRQFYLYDGGENRAVQIEHDRKRVLYGLAEYNSKNYDPDGEYYKEKIVADAYDIKDTGKTVDTFYNYDGLLGNGGVLQTEYGGNWKKQVATLLNKYGRSALRQSYEWYTIGGLLDDEDLAMQWLDWQLDMFYMNKYGVDDLYGYYNVEKSAISNSLGRSGELLVLNYDPRDPDLIGTVEITKSSLSVFSILENNGSIDADYAYRDFKELIVELNYFDRSELSSKISEVFTWILPPESSSAGWPNRPVDKPDTEYGTLIQSKATYEALATYMGIGEGSTTEETPETAEPTAPTETPEVTEETTTPSSTSDVSMDYVGYEAGKMVVSPVTGKILEYGKHTRINVYTGEEEEVGYIILEPMTSKYFTDAMTSGLSFMNTATADDATYSYSVSEALNLFFDEYDDVCVVPGVENGADTIMIDGIDVDLNLVDEEGNQGKYDIDNYEVHALYNSEQMEIRKGIRKAKADAPYFIPYGVSSTAPSSYVAGDGLNGYYVKEGKYIGKTIENEYTGPATVPATSGEEGKLTYDEYQGPSDYIRILMQDMDLAIIEDVEGFFDIPVVIKGNTSGTGTGGVGGTGEGGTAGDGSYTDLESITDSSSTEERIKAIMGYLISKGLTPQAAAGVAGNIAVECQFSEKGRLVRSDKSYYGLCQWNIRTSGDKAGKGRWKNVVDWIVSQGYSQTLDNTTSSFAGQLRAAIECSTEAPNMFGSHWEEFRTCTDEQEAARLWNKYFEVGNAVDLRKSEAVAALKVWNGESYSGRKPYRGR